MRTASNTNRVAKFDKSGNFIKQWGSTGSGNAVRRRDIGCRRTSNVYVADVGNKRIGCSTPKELQVANIGTPLNVHDDRGEYSLRLALGRS
jgi:hypothetical protein